MNKVSVSIIVPVYNSQNYVERCIKSLICQNFNSYEIICVNDGSTDNSRIIIESMEAQYPNIIRSIHTENMGSWRARKLGIELARGKYIGFCDSDDYIEPDMFQKLYDAAEINNVQMAVCAFRRVDNQKSRVYQIEMNQFGCNVLEVKNDIGALAVINTSLWNKIYLADVIKNAIDFDYPPRIAEDTILLGSIFPKIERIAFIDKCLYNYTIHTESKIKNINKEDIDLTKNAMINLKKYVVNNQYGDQYISLIDLMAFIHIGIALPILSYSSIPLKQMIKYNYEIKHDLIIYFSSWATNNYLKLNYILKHHRNLFKVKILQVIYKLGMFTIFLKLYGILIRKLHIENKW